MIDIEKLVKIIITITNFSLAHKEKYEYLILLKQVVNEKMQM